jgi:hypothetical protein
MLANACTLRLVYGRHPTDYAEHWGAKIGHRNSNPNRRVLRFSGCMHHSVLSLDNCIHSFGRAQIVFAAVACYGAIDKPGIHFLQPAIAHSKAIAVGGMSCGGVQAIEASVDPHIKTTIVANSGLMTEPTTMTGSGKPVPKESLNLMHAPALYMSGDESDIACANANDDFEKINHMPVFRAYQKGIGHRGTYHDTDGGTFGKVTLAWLDWQLKGDKEAAKMFQGDKCGLCTDPQWVTRKNKID